MAELFIRAKNFISREDGINTVEIVIILAILIGVAIIFKEKLHEMVNSVFDEIGQRSWTN